MTSFDDLIVEKEPDRFIKKAFEENPNIKNLAEFREALEGYLKAPKGDISAETFVRLFESQAVKDLIKENVSAEEYDKLYGDGLFVKREVVGRRIVTITQPKISIHSHTRAGIKVRAYSKSYRKWKPSEIKFLSVRKKQKKLTSKQIITEYNKHFRENPRSSSSIKTKVFRI
jgi:hypothetical protein